MDLSSSIFNAPLIIAQGDSVQRSVQSSGSHTDRAESSKLYEQIPRNPVILYAISSFLANGTWEEITVAMPKRLHPRALCVELDERNLTVPDVVAIVVIFSAAQHVALRRNTIAKLRTARASYPTVRLVLIAAGLTDEQVRDEDGHHLLRTAGYTVDNARFLICATEDDFESSLLSHIRVAIDVGNMQSVLDETRRNAATDQELRP
jgi:hypothetical protein